MFSPIITFFFIGVVLLVFFFIIIENMTPYRAKDFFSRARYKSVIIATAKKITYTLEDIDVSSRESAYLNKNELIQTAFRVAQCYPCLEAGKCVHCGCDTEARMNVRTDQCSAGKWGIFTSNEEMNDFLKKFKLEFKVDIIDKQEKTTEDA